jgi:hypothetical protein
MSEQLLLKGKAIQLEAWTGPEDSRRLRMPHFKAWTGPEDSRSLRLPDFKKIST